MQSAETSVSRRMIGACFGTLLAGMAVAGITAPAGSAAPDCSPQGVAGTKDSVTAAAQQYLANHPDANQVLMTAAFQPRPQAEATVRDYASSHPQETSEFRRIIAPLGTLESQCGVQAVPAQFQWAFDQFIG